MENKKEITSELQNRLSSLLEESNAIVNLLKMYSGNRDALPETENKNVLTTKSQTVPTLNETTPELIRWEKKKVKDKDHIKQLIIELQTRNELDSWFMVEDLYQALLRNSRKPQVERLSVKLNRIRLNQQSETHDKTLLSALLCNRRTSDGDIRSIKFIGVTKRCLYTFDKRKVRYNGITNKYEADLKSLPEKYKGLLMKSKLGIEIK